MDLLVAGEVLFDVVAAADGVTRTHLGGSPANVAVAAARLGTRVTLAASVGDDDLGRRARHALAAEGINLDLRTQTAPTSRAVATLTHAGDADYTFDLDTSAALDLQHLVTVALAPVVHVGSISAWHPRSHPAVLALARRAKRAGSLVSLDLNARAALHDDGVIGRINNLIAVADLVKASDADLALLYPNRPAGDVARSWDVPLAVVTRGAKGARAWSRHAGELVVGAPHVEVVDTVGAGDAFTGALLAAFRPDLPDGERLPSALGNAVRVASLSCTRAGADPPRRAELDV